MTLRKLPGQDKPVTLNVVPEMAELIEREGYEVIAGAFCDVHGYGVVILADRDARVRKTRDLKEVEENLKCMHDSFETSVLEIFSDRDDRVR